MNKKRFASFILTGKIATGLPLMAKNSLADIVPSYTDILNSNLSLIETPNAGIRLNTTTGSIYGGDDTTSDALICSNPLPSEMNIVITGLRPGDTVYLVASSNKDDGSFQNLSPSIRIGSSHLTIISSFTLPYSPISENGGSLNHSTSAISIPVDLGTLQQNNLFSGNEFYLQAVSYSPENVGADGNILWADARYSELDKISINQTGCSSSYGGYGGYGGSGY